MTYVIQTIDKEDHSQVLSIVRQFWGDDPLIIHRKIFSIASLNGLKAVQHETIVGILHYLIVKDECEILTLASLHERQGIGTALINQLNSIATAQHCQKIKVTTTNDNLSALGFYQRRGFHLAALFPGQVNISRKYKPEIPEIADNGIPIRDEILLIKYLTEETQTIVESPPPKGHK